MKLICAWIAVGVFSLALTTTSEARLAGKPSLKPKPHKCLAIGCDAPIRTLDRRR